MGEHTFDEPHGRGAHEEAVVRAIELAERVLEEVSRGAQDWRAAATLAAELAHLAKRLADGRTVGREARQRESAARYRTTLRDVP
jgi:hypothetical protein